MPNYGENRFLSELMAAMESNGADMATAPSVEEVKDGILQTETGSADPDGNPEGPGDQSETADPGVVNQPKPEGEDPLLQGSNDPSGNPETPGDGQADPATEGFGDFLQRIVNKHGALDSMDAKEVWQAYLDLCSGDAKANHYGIKAFPEMQTSCGNYANYCREITEVSDDMDYIVVTANGLSGVVSIVKGSTLFKDTIDMVVPTAPCAAGEDMKRKNCKVISRNDCKSVVGKSGRLTASQAPASSGMATEAFEVPDFLKNVNLYKNPGLFETEQQKEANDPSGNPDEPTADEKQTPVMPAGDSKPAPKEDFNKEADDPSGNAGQPGANGTPVSKSGTPTPLGKTEAEKAADDSSGNPDGPGVDATPVDDAFDSFIGACESSMVRRRSGSIFIPDGMSLESYAMELGMHVIISEAMEADLTAAERKALPDSAFGLPEERGWPLHDESHVRSAIKNFHWCSQDKQRELAKNILKAMRKYKIQESDITVTEGSAFLKYAPGCNTVPRKKPQRKA